LKLIYQHGGESSKVPNKVIASGLGVAPSSVTEMLTKLNREGLVDYQPYKGSTLTNAGLISCLDVVRSHRLWEVFLIRTLGYSWSEAHEDAHILEHAAPERMMTRLNKFLNYPDYCPHGAAIPRPSGDIAHSDLTALATLSQGDVSHIRMVTEEKNFLDYIQTLGITIGARVEVISLSDHEDHLLLAVDDKETLISYSAAGQIFVDVPRLK